MVCLMVICTTCIRRANQHAAQKAAAEADVAVINRRFIRGHKIRRGHKGITLALSGSLLVITALPLNAAVLPEDRADIVRHVYSGGGVTIDGPAVLVRKKLKDKYSVNAKYYVDSVSSASIDVQTTASRYSEERTEYSVGLDALNDKTTYSLNYTTSTENDYDAESAHADVSHDFFGDLTTLSLGFSQGWDTVGKNYDDNWIDREIDRRNYRASLSQVVSKDTILNFAFESIVDEGSDNRALGNPYRSVRVFDADSGIYSFDSERYPTTRNSDAWAIKLRHSLENKSVIFGEHRQFTDSWGIDAWHVQIGYIYPIEPKWLFEVRARHYEQTSADFYSDLLETTNLNFYARDKELSTFDNDSVGLSASFEHKVPEHWPINKFRASFMFDYFMFDYSDFRDARKLNGTPGTEPMYDFNARVARWLFSVWY